MKVTLNKAVFALDEKELIKQFKAEWAIPTMGDIETAVKLAAYCVGIAPCELVAVREIELTKNRYKPTYWVATVVKGWSKDGEVYAEIGFDYIQAMLSALGDEIDNFTFIYKRV